MACYENFRWIVGESEYRGTVHDTEDLFKSNFALLSRGRSRRNFLIITFPQSNVSASVSPHNLKNILQYIVSLTSNEDAKQGFVLIFDRRDDYWSTVCSNLAATIENFPAAIQKIYVLQPSSFIQRNRIDPTLKFLHDDHKYKVLLLNNVEELHQHIDTDQLTSHLNGSLAYNHPDWMLKQKTFEKLSYEISSLTEKLKAICQTQQEDDFPNSSGETEQLLIDHELMRADAEDQFDSLTNKVVVVFDEEEHDADSPKYLTELFTISQRLASIIDAAKKSFKNFCSKYRTKLEHCLQLRKFEEEFKQVQIVIEKYNNYLQEICVNPDLNKAENNHSQLLSFQENTKADISQAKELLKCGLEFIEDKLYAVDCIKPKCFELENMIVTFDQLLSSKSKQSQKSLSLLTMLENVNKLCTEGVDLLAHQSVEDYKSDSTTKTSIETIDRFLSSTNTVDLDFININLKFFAGDQNSEFTKSSEQLLSKFMDVRGMCTKRKESLLSSINKKVRPIQLVVPEISANAVADESGSKSCRIESPNRILLKPDFLTPVKKKETLRHKNSSSDYMLIKPSIDVAEQYNKDMNKAPLEQRRRAIINFLRETEISYLSQLSKLSKLIESKESSEQQMCNYVDWNVVGDTVTKIHNFHASSLSRILLNLYQVPSLIGRHFIEMEEKFEIYHDYFVQLNHIETNSKQEECNPLFNEAELKLLKVPLQRLHTFYKSITDFSKISNEDNILIDLKSTRKMLAKILGIEDKMEAVEPSEPQERRIILQGVFQMHTESKKDLLKDFINKYKQRQLFLYNDKLTVCKKVGNDFLTLVSLPLSSIGITENVKSDKKKFEIWLNNRSEVYSFQAQNIGEKEVWIKELNKILFNQFHQIKAFKNKQVL